MLVSGFGRSKMCDPGEQEGSEHFSKPFERDVELLQMCKDHFQPSPRSSQRILEICVMPVHHTCGSATFMGLVSPIQN